MTTGCGQCGASLSAGAKFCSECGAAQGPRSCPFCGADAPTGRFCGECGSPIAPGRDLPTVPATAAERRVASILFADVVGFTARSESADPEDVRDLQQRYFSTARQVIERYGGTVEKFIGDAVMAVWGVPMTYEDDAERTVRAGLELVTAVHGLAAEGAADRLSLRVGIVTGEVAVTVGAVGQGMVAGDAVNTASRVQSLAEPGRVWVDERTRALTASSVSYRAVGSHPLKGKASPVALYEADTVMAAVGGGDRVDGLEARLVGRDRELRLVKELFHSCEESGRPTVLVLQGEAGVGKSRLAWEFEKYIDGLQATMRWHRGRCLSYGEGVAFWALTEAVKVRLGLVDADAATSSADQLDQALAAWVPDRSERDWLRPRLAVLLGTGEPEPAAREELFSAWVTFLERVGADSPAVVLVVDDAQHADGALLDFFEHMLTVARSAIFVVLLARPGLVERRPSLVTRRGTTVLHLEPLADDDMGALLDGLVEDLPTTLRADLIDRAEGIPLYAMETVRALIDRDLVVASGGRYVLADATTDLREIAAPASLQSLVTARLDALTPDERSVISDASVLGLSFTRDGLQALAGPDLDLAEALRSLVAKQLLSVQTDRFSADHGQYRFVQTVVRQVAYDMLARRERKARHLAAAAYLQSVAENGDELAAVVAEHYLDALAAAAEDDPDLPELLAGATTLLERAAARARSLGANTEAAGYLARAIAQPQAPADLARLCEAAARACFDAGAAATGRDRALQALKAYREVGDESGRLRTVGLLGRILLNLGSSAEALELLTPAWAEVHADGKIVEDLAAPALQLAKPLAILHQNLGNDAEAGAVLDKLMLLAEGSDDPAEVAEMLVALGVSYWTRGGSVVGRLLMKGAADLAGQHGLTGLRARAMSNLAASLLPDDPEAAIEHGRAALDASIRSGLLYMRWNAAANLELALWTAGRWSELDALLHGGHFDSGCTEEVIQESVWSWLRTATGLDQRPEIELAPPDDPGLRSWHAHYRQLRRQAVGDRAAAVVAGAESVDQVTSGLGDDFMHFWPSALTAALDAGDLATADRLLAVVAESREGYRSPAVRAQLHRLQALLLAARDGDGEVVEAGLRRAIAALAEYGAVPARARTQQELGGWLRSVGRTAEAEEMFEAARTTYQQLGAQGWLAQLERSRVAAATG